MNNISDSIIDLMLMMKRKKNWVDF